MRRNWLARLLTLVAVFALIWGVRSAALWDPHELSVAELSRRIGLNLLGGGGLAIPGADNSLPIRADLGRGELPFSSAALGFRVFGLSEWAGRLPLVLWSLLGLASVHAALSRLWDRRAALYAVLILATTPLYFLQARTLLGDAVTLAAFAIAWSGLSVALFAAPLSRRMRLGFALLGVLGLYAGFWCRGPIVSVAVPALSVGLVSRFVRPVRTPLASWLGLGLSLVGLAALTLGLFGLSLAQHTGDYSVFVGSALSASAELPTFDISLGQFAHAAFPWSAAAPLALTLPFADGRAASGDGQDEPRVAAQRAAAAAAALGLGMSLAAAAWLQPLLGMAVLPGLGCFAVLLACALREVESGRLGSPLLGLVVAALAIVLGFDLREHPEKALASFGLPGVTLPEGLQVASARLWTVSALALAVAAVLCFYERDRDLELAPALRRSEYEQVLANLQRVWDGNLVFALLVLEAALVGFLLLSAVSERLVHMPQLDNFGALSRQLVAAAAVAVPLAVLVPLGAMLLRDVSRIVFGGRLPGPLRELSPTRAEGVLLVCAGIGLSASLSLYPALARQVSPKQVFERYRELGRPGEPLGMLGEQNAAARYQGGAEAEHLQSIEPALEWLAGPPGATAPASRRWLLVRKADLAELNASFRAQHSRNLPVLDARSSELLLTSNRRLAGERDESPLAPWLLDRAPHPQHPIQAIIGGKLAVLGWSLESALGGLEEALIPATHYRFIIYYRVLAPISGGWQTFVHIDGLQRRFNADHELLEGKYPLELWRPNDTIADATDLILEPNFSPGTYRVYFGLFNGTRRLEVTEGRAEDDRIVAGTLQVR